jgi:hypothetical protein
MAELNANTGSSEYVDELIHSFGSTTKDGIVKNSFGWKGTIDDIQYLEASCSHCTKVWYEDNVIHYELTISKVQTFAKGQTTVTKDIYIWLNDGNERFISNDKKQKVLNPDKKYIKYRITGLVLV